MTSQHVSNNESLQCIYLDCINECLEALDSLKAAAATGQDGGEDSDSQYESDHTSSSSAVAAAGSLAGRCEKVVSMIFTLLSMIEAHPSMMRLTKKIDALFAVLLQASYPMGTMKSRGLDKVEQVVVTFEPERIYACLIGRCNGFLISRLYEVEDYLRRKRVAEEASLATQSRYGSWPRLKTESGGGDTPTRGSDTGHQKSVATTKDEWNNRFYDAMYDHKHLLENVLERGLQLIHTGHVQEVTRLLECPEFIPLRPVLLLLGWDRYNAAGSGKELLDALWPMEVCAVV